MPAYLKQLCRLASWSLILSLSLSSCGGQTTPPINGGGSVVPTNSFPSPAVASRSPSFRPSAAASPTSRPSAAASPTSRPSAAASPSPQPLSANCDGTPLTNAPVPNGFGVNGWGYAAADLDGMKAAGFCWMRTDFAWNMTEYTKGQYNFSYFDAFLAALEQRGIHPLFIMDYSNPLYVPAGSFTGFGSSITTETERRAFARWAAAAVQHYKGHTIIWELWNEPNSAYSSNNYMALANEALPAMRQADPNVRIIAPATFSVDLGFLSSVFSQGLLPMIDGVSVHPYRSDIPESFAGDYASLKSLIGQYHGNVPIVSGEWGYNIGSSVSPSLQGEYLARMMLSNLSLGTALSIWFCWSDSSSQDTYPIFKAGSPPTPAYQEMKRLTTALGGYTFERTLSSAANDHILLFSGGGRTMLAAWTTGNAHAVTLPDGKSIMLTNDPIYTAP